MIQFYVTERPHADDIAQLYKTIGRLQEAVYNLEKGSNIQEAAEILVRTTETFSRFVEASATCWRSEEE